jgi:hypothetical protein
VSIGVMTGRCGHALYLGRGFGHAVGVSAGFRRAGVRCLLNAR